MTVPRPWVRIVAVAALLAAALCGLVIREGAARNAGQEVRLPITGYDPRSLLSGHYVQFAIEWRTAGAGRCPPGSDAMSPVLPWVALRREGEGHVAGGAASTRAEASRLGDIVVRGLTCPLPDPSV